MGVAITDRCTQVSKQNAYNLAGKRTRLGRGPNEYDANFYLLMRPRTGSWIDDSISVIYCRGKVILISYGLKMWGMYNAPWCSRRNKSGPIIPEIAVSRG